MKKKAPAVVVSSPDKFYEDKPHIPTGYSFQTGKVHSTWSDLESEVKRQGEARGEEVSFERDNDYRKMKGRRYKWCCGEVQPKYSQCRHCNEVIS